MEVSHKKQRVGLKASLIIKYWVHLLHYFMPGEFFALSSTEVPLQIWILVKVIVLFGIEIIGDPLEHLGPFSLSAWPIPPRIQVTT